MRIFINTLGSYGDVQPFVALGKGLQSAGHAVTICTSSSFQNLIVSHGLGYGYVTDEITKLIDTDSTRKALEGSKNIVATINNYRKVAAQVGPLQRQMLEQSWEAARQANPDVVIYHEKAFGAPHIAEKLGIPAILAMLQPLHVPTGAFANPALPNLPLGQWYNKFTYNLLNTISQKYTAGYTKEWRLARGMSPKLQDKSRLHQWKDRPLPVLHAFSEHVVPRPEDWPAHALVTGYWFLKQQDDWEPSNELQAFLDAGEAPVYVGFGSMSGRDPRRVTQTVVDALRLAGVRGILATGWGGLSAQELPESIMQLDHAPHDWLFPRMAAVVHHGGAGTTAAGLRAGCPTVICPFFGDQPFWGRRVAALGVGSEPIPQRRLTAEKLAAAIRQVVGDTRIRANAQLLGAQLRAEDGIGKSIAVIDTCMQTTV